MLADDFTCIDIEADNLQVYDFEEPTVPESDYSPTIPTGLRVTCPGGCGEFDLEEVNFTLRHGLVVSFRCPVCNEFQKTDMVIRG